MSGIEIALPIIATIAAIVSAYKDGGTILNKIKERRQKKGARPPTESLQQAFRRGETEVTRAREDIEERFGADFQADPKTTRALKDITIALQDTIIRQLSAAQDDDEMDDFSPCINAAVKARQQAVVLLYQLSDRLEAQERLGAGAREDVDPYMSRQTTQRFDDPYMSRQTTQRFEDPTIRGPIQVPTARSERTNATPPQSPPRTRTFSSVMRFGRRQPSTGSPAQTIPPATNTASQASPRLIPDNQFLASSNAVLSSSPEMRRSPGLSPVTPVSPYARSSVMSSPEALRAATSMSGYQTPVVIDQPREISEENDYLGLCKGAWRVQRQEFKKGMEQSIKGFDRSYHCRYCKFNLPADTWNKNEPCFDDRMKVSGQVYFRYLFLFKTHIKRKNGQQQYKCIFCLLAGQSSLVYNSADHLLEHALSHRGTWYGATELEGPCEVSPTTVSRTHIGDFDICFKAKRTSSISNFSMLPEAALKSEPQQLHELEGDPEHNPWQ